MFTPSNRRRVYAPSGGKLMTKQSMKNECDINNILSQFRKTGIINHITQQNKSYGDLPDTIDYQQSMNIIIQADEAFSALPSVVRRYFDNDPNLLLSALGNPDMADKLTELGILNPKPQPQPPGNPENVDLSHEPKLP